MTRIDELVFMFGVDPSYIERAPLTHIEFWHRRAFAYAQATAGAKEHPIELNGKG